MLYLFSFITFYFVYFFCFLFLSHILCSVVLFFVIKINSVVLSFVMMKFQVMYVANSTRQMVLEIKTFIVQYYNTHIILMFNTVILH